MLPHACAFSFLGVQIMTSIILKYSQWYTFSNIISICVLGIILRDIYHDIRNAIKNIYVSYCSTRNDSMQIWKKVESADLLFILSFFSSVHTIMISQSVKFQLCGRCFRVRRCCILPQFLMILYWHDFLYLLW